MHMLTKNSLISFIMRFLPGKYMSAKHEKNMMCKKPSTLFLDAENGNDEYVLSELGAPRKLNNGLTGTQLATNPQAII